MSLAIYQKMQDDNVRGVNFSELTHCLSQYSTTSDGYEALGELLRRVHPNLNEGKIEHTMPKLSECDYALRKRRHDCTYKILMMTNIPLPYTNA